MNMNMVRVLYGFFGLEKSGKVEEGIGRENVI